MSFYSIPRKSYESYLPIACSDGFLRKGQSIGSRKELRLSWIGRFCDFKIYILNYLIQELSKSSIELGLELVLYIIGEGPHASKLRISENTHERFNVVLLGSLSKDDLDRFLISNVDINASMGTSALEAAKFGIPTIVLDFDYKRISRKYRFRWLHDTVEYDLGHLITDSDYEGYTMNEVIKLLMTNQSMISERAYYYYRTNHSLESVSQLLIEAILSTKFSVNEMNPKLFRKGVLRNFYELNKYGKINRL